MKTIEIIDRIEEIIDSRTTQTNELENKSDKSIVRDIMYLLLQLFLNILKAPFDIVVKYIKKEIIANIKRDAKLYALIMGVMVVLFVFFSVLWLSLSVAVGVYFYSHNYSMLMSVIYSIVFQFVSFVVVGLIAYIASKKIKSFNLLKTIIQNKK